LPQSKKRCLEHCLSNTAWDQQRIASSILGPQNAKSQFSLFEYLFNELCIMHIGIQKLHWITEDFSDLVDCGFIAIAKVIKNTNLMARLRKTHHSVAANISCATSNENIHAILIRMKLP
jgi:hypothetical protein